MDSPSPPQSRHAAGSVKLLLFDVDGTLVRSYGGALRAMTAAARRLFGPTFSLEEVDRNGRLDPQIIDMALKWNGVRATRDEIDAFRDLYIEQFRAEVGSTRILPGAGELLDSLRATEDVVLGLVTGNYAEAARVKLKAVGIDPAWFRTTAFGEDAPTRSGLVRLAIETAASLTRQPIPAGRVIVIGDTPRDIESAKANGCLSLVVATGNYSVEALEAAGADAVLPDLTDPAPLWAMLGGLD